MIKKHFKKIICGVLTAALAVWLFFFNITIVSGVSMMPTLKDGDVLIAQTRCFDIKPGDIVVASVKGELLIKRVIAVPGDTVQIMNSYVFVNDEIIEGSPTTDFSMRYDDPTVVPEGKYFLLGDNREQSRDSRVFGFVDEDNILGIIVYGAN